MDFYIADLHFGHENIIKLCNRPFSCMEEMDKALIENWNAKVRGGDTVYIVGDLIWKGADADKYLSALKGRKILVLGNHDTQANNENFRKYFFRIENYMEINSEGRCITLCHYPMIEWRASRKQGSSKLGYLIFGHIHNNIEPEYSYLLAAKNALNAGVDINNFAPCTFDELVLNNALAYGRNV